MKIGVNLPGHIPGTNGATLLEWARRADAGPFSSVGIIDRLVYQNWEPMIALTAAAAVTTRVRLVTNVLIMTLRNAGLFAKEAATLDVLSNGRLTLGISVGAREPDFLGAPAPFRARGKRFEEQLDMMKRIWAGESAAPGSGPVGPAPVQQGGPELLIGANQPAAIARVGKWANGFIVGPRKYEVIQQTYALAQESWRKHGRPGKPRLVGAYYYSLGPDADAAAERYQRDYWAFDPALVSRYLPDVLNTPQRIKDMIRRMEGLGMDEIVFMSCDRAPDQVYRLADVVA